MNEQPMKIRKIWAILSAKSVTSLYRWYHIDQFPLHSNEILKASDLEMPTLTEYELYDTTSLTVTCEENCQIDFPDNNRNAASSKTF